MRRRYYAGIPKLPDFPQLADQSDEENPDKEHPEELETADEAAVKSSRASSQQLSANQLVQEIVACRHRSLASAGTIAISEDEAEKSGPPPATFPGSSADGRHGQQNEMLPAPQAPACRPSEDEAEESGPPPPTFPGSSADGQHGLKQNEMLPAPQAPACRQTVLVQAAALDPVVPLRKVRIARASSKGKARAKPKAKPKARAKAASKARQGGLHKAQASSQAEPTAKGTGQTGGCGSSPPALEARPPAKVFAGGLRLCRAAARTYLQGRFEPGGGWKLIVKVSERMTPEHRVVCERIMQALTDDPALGKEDALNLRRVTLQAQLA